MIHLSETGYYAGRRFCLAKGGESVHAIYAPLNNDQYRAKVCPDCLHVWANEAYDPDDCKPWWVVDIRNKRD